MTLQRFLSLDALVTAMVALVFGLIVITRNKKNIINQTGFLLTLATAFWSFGYWHWMAVYNDRELALFWVRILSIGSSLIPLFYFHWIISLLGLNKKKKRLIFLSYFLTAFFLLFSFSDLFVKTVNPVSHFTFWPEAGPLYTIYLISVYFSLVIYSVWLLLKERAGSFGSRREQIKYVLLGTIIGFGGGATNFPLWYGINIFPIGTILVVLYPILFSYAIIRHRFMDIQLALRRSFVFLMSVLMVVIPSYGVLFLADRYARDYIIFINLAVVALAVSIFPSIKDYYYRIANKYFFSSLYDSNQVIAKLSDGLRSTLDVSAVYNLISETLTSSMHIKALAVLNFDEASQQYYVKFNNGFDLNGRLVFPSDSILHKDFIEMSRPIVVEELRATAYRTHKEILDLLISLKVALIIPLNVQSENLGIITLGHKESGDMYNDEDLKTLTTIASQSALAIKNAQLYDETKGFSLKLQKEVARQTNELKQANEDLKKLDKAKSDFISIASHQLRTPLTAIKGFTSMILEGSYGRTTKVVHDKLEKIYESSERLIRLVNDLLDLSHMEGGKMEFNFQKINFTQMVKSVCEELDIQAQKKKLKLIVTLSDPELFVKADEQKLRQVVMNLVDNAIKYTEKGKAEVFLKERDGKIEFSVKDTGMGMKPEEIANLFQKFVRGSEASHYHTEGAGIGLYVARQLIEAHQGRVWAESEGEGKGSTFLVEVPEFKE